MYILLIYTYLYLMETYFNTNDLILNYECISLSLPYYKIMVCNQARL